VHLFAIASNLAGLDGSALEAEAVRVGRDFGLDPSTAWRAESSSGRTVAAGLHHAREICGPRRYVFDEGSAVTWFDGLPVSAAAGETRDAGRLAARWKSLAGNLEGQFCVGRLEGEGDRAFVLTDALGLSQVFWAHAGGGVLVSNSATLIVELLGLSAPDALGVSSFLGLGWCGETRTLNEGVRVLAGGARHTIANGTISGERHFGPSDVPRIGRGGASAGELAGTLTALTEAAVAGMPRVGCALTAGRDSRVLAALLESTDAEVLYFTGGSERDADVVIAREIAQRLGLEHEVVTHDPSSETVDWTRVAELFMRQNDGLVSLLQLPDHIHAPDPLPPLGVKLGGVGGEIGRAGTGPLTAIATNAPLVRRSRRVQERLLALKVRNEGGLMTAAAVEEIQRYLKGFQAARLEEGWRPAEMQEAFYAFERVGRWAATGTRRVAITDDGFSPFCTRPFIEYCFSLRSGERLVEAPHYRLLSELSPLLRDHRFETPMRRQNGSLARLMVARQALGLIWARRPRVASRSTPAPSAEPRVSPAYPFQHRWLEGRLDLIAEIFAADSSPLWELVDRDRVHQLLRGEEAGRARSQEALLRAATVFWHFHGPKPAASHWNSVTE